MTTPVFSAQMPTEATRPVPPADPAPHRRRDPHDEDDGIDPLDLALPLLLHRRRLVLWPLAMALLALGLSFVLAPTFTARTSFLPPQPPPVASTLASLGALAGLGSGLGGGAPADKYVALLQSRTIADRIIEAFGLSHVYELRHRAQIYQRLARNVRITIGRRDGLVVFEIDDEDPQRAADIANRYIAELQRLTGELALTESQQRRVFFEGLMARTGQRLAAAQQALQASGFDARALRAEPRTAAEAYARAKAEVAAGEVRLERLRQGLADGAPEVQQQLATLSALRRQLAQAETAADAGARGPGATGTGGDYVSTYREFKYQETLFDMFARQYESARVDEAREGAPIQIVDRALRPELRSAPRRGLMMLLAAVGGFVGVAAWTLARHVWRGAAADPRRAAKVARLRAALGRR